MRRTFLLALAAGSMLAQAPVPPKTHLKVGDKAPAFQLPSTRGGQVSLADFHGKSTVVLAFFPAAFTAG
jgi:peroxiredoxin